METAKVKNGRSKKIGYFCLTHVTEIVLVVVIIALWLANPNFMRISNWMNLLRSGAIKGIIALGVTMVLIAGKIDLSLGSQVALSGVIVAVFGKNMTAAGWSDLTVPCLIGMGVSLGTFVDAWLGPWMHSEKEGRVTESQFLMHEFGHTADSQRFGWAYLPVVGLPSLISAVGKGNHKVFWTETRANRHAKRYFSKHYAVAWNEKGYPLENPSEVFQA